MAKAIVIIGNGTLADNPKSGSGVQHSYKNLEPVAILEKFHNDAGDLIRLRCTNKEGKTQIVMPEHVNKTY